MNPAVLMGRRGFLFLPQGLSLLTETSCIAFIRRNVLLKNASFLLPSTHIPARRIKNQPRRQPPTQHRFGLRQNCRIRAAILCSAKIHAHISGKKTFFASDIGMTVAICPFCSLPHRLFSVFLPSRKEIPAFSAFADNGTFLA
ncbi:hypothetical protein [Mailhella massiliensis]|uniref:hypothetical protein n=1 Tax=Mailhella massiliensis TaxID=1903261 RepID=UPI002352F97F|nr:hypothetical protein [Mailhella massiliensis]